MSKKVTSYDEAVAAFRDFLADDKNKSASMEWWKSADGVLHTRLVSAIKFIIKKKGTK